MEKNIKKWIMDHKEEIFNDLLSLVRCEASTADIEELKVVRNRLSEIIEDRLQIKPEEIQVDSTRNVLYTPFEEKENPVLLIGHYDTVHPIHKVPIVYDKNVFKGPGVLDMKAGVIQAIWACKAIRDLKLSHQSAIHLLFNGDEEYGSQDSKEIIIQKAKKAKAAFVLEPAVENGNLKTGRKGGMACDITICGKASHAGNHPEEGIHAIHEMAYYILELQALNENEYGTTINVGKVNGGTAINVIPDQAHISVDIRYKTLKEKQRIKKAIENIPLKLKGTTKNIEFSEGSNPMEQTKQNLELFELAKQCAKELNMEIDRQFVGGASDGNRISFLGLPILDGLGAIGQGIHATNEQIDLEKYYERICLLILLLTKI